MHNLSPSPAPLPATERRFLRLREVEQRTGFKRAFIYKMIREGRFPKQIPLSSQAVGWDSMEIEAWFQERLRSRR